MQQPSNVFTSTTSSITGQAISSPQQNVLSSGQIPINPETNRPYGTFTPAPSRLSGTMNILVPKEERKVGAGIVGTIASLPTRAKTLISEKAGGLYSQYAQKTGDYSRYGETISLVKAAPDIAYFTPAGSTLLVSAGAEQLLTPSGQRQSIETKQYYEAQGSSPIWAGIKTYAPPVASVGLGAWGGFTQFNKPINKIITPASEKLTAVDVLQPVASKEGQVERGLFRLKIVRTTPEIAQTTRVRELFGMKPKNIIPQKTNVYYSYTPDFIYTKEGIIQQPANIITKRVGANFGTISNIAGGQTQISPEDFAKLPKNVQYAYQRLAEAKAGIPVSLKNTPKVLGKDLTYSTGILNVKKIARINPSKNEMDIFLPTGKSVNVGEVNSISKKLTTPEGSPYEIYAYKIGVKDITKPLSRATGKIPKIKGLSLILPASSEEAGSFGNILQTTKAGKSSNILKQMQSAATKTIPNARTPSIKPLSNPLRDLAKLGGSIGLVSAQPSSAYAGTGQYERTEGITGLTIQQPRTNQIVSPLNIQASAPSTKLEQKQFPFLQTSQLLNQQLKQQQSPFFNNAVFDRAIQKLKQSQLLNLEQKQQQKQMQKQVQKQMTKQLSKQMQIPRITPRPKTTRIPPIFSVPKSNQSSLISAIGKVKKAYNVKIRRKGKIIDIGKNLPYFKALKLGAETTKSELAQTFGLEPSGYTRQQDITYQLNPRIFTIPKQQRTKISSLTFVEKRGQTLTTYPEIKGLQKARKVKWW